MTFGAVLKIDPSAISRRTEHTPANQYHTRHSSVKVKLNSSKLTNINKTHMPQIFKNSDGRIYLSKKFLNLIIWRLNAFLEKFLRFFRGEKVSGVKRGEKAR